MSKAKTISPDKCAVTRDLMPLCIDGDASEASRSRVEKHVALCPDCAEIYRDMQTRIDPPARDDPEAATFDSAVKKVKHRNAWRRLRNVLLGVVLALAVCAGAAWGYWRYFVEEVPVPVNDYALALTLHTSGGDTTPLVIQAEKLPKSARVHIEVRREGTVMDDDRRLSPNLTMYVWAATTRTADASESTPSRSYYAFDRIGGEEQGLWCIDGETLKVNTIFQGAPDGEQTLLYKTGFRDNLKWTATDTALYAVDSLTVADDAGPVTAFATPVPAPTPLPAATVVPAGLPLY